MKCSKIGHFKKNYRSKSVERGKGSEDTSSIENKSSIKEGGDVYLASKSTHSKYDCWLIASGAFHMNPHEEWFYEYEKYNGNFFLGDDSPKKIIWHRRVMFLLNDGRIKTLLGVFHIPSMAKTLIYLNKMANANVKTIFEKERCKMV